MCTITVQHPKRRNGRPNRYGTGERKPPDPGIPATWFWCRNSRIHPDDRSMEDLQNFAPGAVVVLKAVLLLALPVIGAKLIWGALKFVAPDGFFAVPLVYTLARLIGVGLGFLLVYVHQDSRNFDLHEIFVPDGPWNITFAEFLFVRVNPFNYGLIEFIGKLEAARGLPLLSGAILTAFLMVSIGWSWKIWNRMPAGRASICVVLIALTTAFLTVYGVSLLFWLLFLFNSWTFLLLALALHYIRSRN